MLIFPKGIRLASLREIPNSADKPTMLEKMHSAHIEQGYTVQKVEDALFGCYIEVNVDAPQIWQFFRALCEELLPDKITPIIGEIDEEPLHNGKNDRKEKLLALFEQFQFYLVNDCYIQFGFVSESETELEEIFVTPTKHFQIWTNKYDVVVEIMKRFSITESKDLQFIDEFPRTTKVLEYENGFYSHDDLINHLVEITGEQNSD